MVTTIHPTAIVDEGAEIGDGSRVWHWVHICGKAKIGRGCSLGQNVFVGNDVVIGNNVKIQNNVSVYDAVRIEDDVFAVRAWSSRTSTILDPRSHAKTSTAEPLCAKGRPWEPTALSFAAQRLASMRSLALVPSSIGMLHLLRLCWGFPRLAADGCVDAACGCRTHQRKLHVKHAAALIALTVKSVNLCKLERLL